MCIANYYSLDHPPFLARQENCFTSLLRCLYVSPDWETICIVKHASISRRTFPRIFGNCSMACLNHKKFGGRGNRSPNRYAFSMCLAKNMVESTKRPSIMHYIKLSLTSYTHTLIL